ncbi:MAG: hypothetical protein HYW77_02870 [Parcubacteria group bacterium]|nr:hypothetical protein [Parcubacteria group bacterium]
MENKLYRISAPTLLVLFISNIWFQMELSLSWRVWLDVTYHFFGGFFVAMFLYAYLNNSLQTKIGFLQRTLVIVGATLFIGVMWEFAEYGASFIFDGSIPKLLHAKMLIGGLDDTINDLLMDFLGSFIFSVVHLRTH